MNASALSTPSADRRAAGLADATPGSPWPWRRLLLATIGLALLLAIVVLAYNLPLSMPLHVQVDGEELLARELALGSADPAERVVLAALLLAGLLAATLIVPIVLVGAVALAVGFVLVVVGVPLLVALAVFAVLLSPLLLLGWIVWRLAAG